MPHARACAALPSRPQRGVLLSRAISRVTSETALLQSVVDAAATLFDAEAASIAIFEPDPSDSSSGSRRAPRAPASSV